ncbi:MAG: hypothetical protein JXR64_00585, partial [Spirochaetales bacterium]|nr:hypothetical protein [Spirochaetales bacterium]
VDGVVDTKWNDETATLLGIETEGKSSSGTSFKTLWDNKYLYVLVDVVDKELNNASENPWEQDSIEIFIDQNNEKSTSYQQDDAQYRVSYTNFVTFNGGDQDGFKSAVSLTEQGYMVEVAVPISYIEMKPGQVIGFDVQINNADSSGSRVGVRNWANSTNLGYQDTSDFGLLKFD